MRTAFLIDGAFFFRRISGYIPKIDRNDSTIFLDGLQLLIDYHIKQSGIVPRHSPFNELLESESLFRIFFYDCLPATKKVHLPISKVVRDLSKTNIATARLEFQRQIRGLRKVALRLGRLSEFSEWRLKIDAQKRLLANRDEVMNDDDFELDIKQKGVDMRLGIDIATLAFRKQVQQIILVANDADFVPAIKLARREGIDVVLDTLGMTPADELMRNIDGHRTIPQPKHGRTTP
jgi:uncharacterized LabA/DUF88 family protein